MGWYSLRYCVMTVGVGVNGLVLEAQTISSNNAYLVTPSGNNNFLNGLNCGNHIMSHTDSYRLNSHTPTSLRHFVITIVAGSRYMHDELCDSPITGWQCFAVGQVLRLASYHGRVDSRLAPSQWETSLQSNAVSHWLGANLGWALPQHLTNRGIASVIGCCASMRFD